MYDCKKLFVCFVSCFTTLTQQVSYSAGDTFESVSYMENKSGVDTGWYEYKLLVPFSRPL